MNLEAFIRQRQVQLEAQPKYRKICLQCRQPEFSCYCEYIHEFDPKIKFVILIHPIEMKRRIATGRMSHQCLQNSELILGQDYSEDKKVNEILNNPQFDPVVLYPGRFSLNLTQTTEEQRKNIFKQNKTPVVFVIDGTWATARKTMHLSQNLKQVPRICFTPPGKSQFRVRKQPGVDCYSTIEAIHHTLELLGKTVGFQVESKKHDHLMFVFNKMVERQLEFVREAFDNPRSTSYRRPKVRVA